MTTSPEYEGIDTLWRVIWSYEGGEDSAWLTLTIANESFDLCTRACAHEFLDRPEVAAAHDDHVEAITDIARTIRDDRDNGGEASDRG